MKRPAASEIQKSPGAAHVYRYKPVPNYSTVRLSKTALSAATACISLFLSKILCGTNSIGANESLHFQTNPEPVAYRNNDDPQPCFFRHDIVEIAHEGGPDIGSSE
jgi:hypothetical protein